MLTKEIEYLGYMLQDLETKIDYLRETKAHAGQIRATCNEYEILSSIRGRLQKL